MSYMTTPAEENQPLLHQNSRNNRPKRVILLIAFVIGITGIAGGLIGLPFVRLIEDAICQEYYASKPGRAEGSVSLFGVDEAHCKVDTVQSRLAYILAIQEMLDAIAGKLKGPFALYRVDEQSLQVSLSPFRMAWLLTGKSFGPNLLNERLSNDVTTESVERRFLLWHFWVLHWPVAGQDSSYGNTDISPSGRSGSRPLFK